jgi:UDP-GlcNAc3NAcA epimerase
MIRIVTVLGARPQFIKAGSVSRELARFSEISEIIVHTGQHYDSKMSDIFFHELEIPKPKYFLNINGLGHGAMTGQMLEAIEKILVDEKPDLVLVYGDTNSTLAGALAACKLHIPVAHIESGLRSHNLFMPEEYNRILTDRIASLLFVPTDRGIKNLMDEGFSNFNCNIILNGDVLLDSALFFSRKTELVSEPIQELFEHTPEFVLATIHRQENTNNVPALRSICQALNEINETKAVVLPLHPRTRKVLENNDIKVDFRTIEPVGYIDMLHLIVKCGLVITDSGGLQKEAYFMNKYCLTIRTETEWTELVENGYNFICGSDQNLIIKNFIKLFGAEIIDALPLYGNGNSSEIIVQNILSYFHNKRM